MQLELRVGYLVACPHVRDCLRGEVGTPTYDSSSVGHICITCGFLPSAAYLADYLAFSCSAYLCSMRSLGVIITPRQTRTCCAMIAQQVRQHNRQYDNSSSVGSSQLWIGIEKDCEA